MTLEAGTKLGSYEITGAIGAGGMGEVYRARDAKLGRDVAMKVLPEAFARDAERMARFQREAKVLASLNHPNIASIYGLEDSGTTHALVMELVEGPTLADRIKSGPIPIDEALRVAKQITEALEYAHERGIVHRDLKPANVKVTTDDAVKVLDFGLAKAIEGDAASIDIATSPTISRMATQAGVLLGTAAYMSPEQAKGKAVDRRADIWAFGCVLYEMLTGKMAFSGETVSDTLASVIKEEPDWSQLPAATPIRVRALLQRCLQKDPKQRLRDIGDARISLDEVLSGAPEPTSVAGQTFSPAWRRALPWVVSGALAAALAIAVWAPWRQRQRGTPLSQFVIVPEKGFSLDRGTQQAISPDGRQLVFAGSSPGGTSSLWLRPLDSVTASPLVGTDDGTQPFWSPDSGSIAFFAHGKLEKMDLSGGPAQSLAEASFPLGGTWGRNGVIVFAPRVGHLYQVPAGGGEATPVTHSGFAQTFPCFLPDGRHFLFMDGSPRSGDRRIYVGSLDSQETKPVLQADWAIYAPPGYLLFLRESTLMTQRFDVAHLSTSDDPSAIAEHVGSFSVSGNGTLVYTPSLAGLTHLVWVDRAGRLISEAAPPGDYSNMQLSPDGKHVAFDGTESGKMDVWLRDLEHGIQSRLTIQGASNVAQWSPDGVSLVFASFNNGGIDLSERPSNMSAPEGVLLKLSAPPILFPSDWSSDGRYLAYYRTDSNSSIQLWILPMFGDRKPFPLVHAEFNESQGQFSPDGRWMAYVSDESGAPEIYVTSFPTPGGIRQISTAGGSQPRWRRDGKELFYVALDRNMMAVTVNTGGTFEADAPRALFETGLPPTPIRQGYSVSPDGQRFLLAVPVEAASPGMTLVQNWTALLKK